MTNNLLLYNVFIPSVRLCAYEQLCYLSKTGKASFHHCKVSKITKDLISNSDVVIMVRSDSYIEEVLAGIFKKAGKYLVYILDDDLLNVPLGLSSSDYYRTDEVKKRIRKIMSLCDCLLSPSKKILGKYGKDFKKTGLIEEPALIYKAPAEKDGRMIKIGFAGSTDRGGDIDCLLSDVIKEVTERYKEDKVKIEFFGAKPNLIEPLGLTYYPYEDSYEDYQKKMWELNWDIGLAPLPDSEFHRSKHYNKYIEYCAYGIIGIYSNVCPYTNVVKDEENGFLCYNSKDAWSEKISWCIDNYDKLGRVRKLIKKDAEVKFSVEQTSELFAKAVPEVLVFKAAAQKTWFIWYELFYLRIISFFIKGYNFTLRNGFKTPVAICSKLWKCS